MDVELEGGEGVYYLFVGKRYLRKKLRDSKMDRDNSRDRSELPVGDIYKAGGGGDRGYG